MKKLLIFLLSVTAYLQAATTADFLKSRVSEIVPSIDGFCSKEKAESFIDLVLEVEPAICVEIGVYQGASLFPVAAALKFIGKGVVIGIDSWDVDEAIKGLHPVRDKLEYTWWKGVDFNQVFDSYSSMISRYGLKDFCLTIRATSQTAAMCCEKIDILHIDGNLSEAIMTQDVVQYFPRVRPGGYIWIGDAGKQRREKPIEFLRRECDLIKSIDGGACLLFRKREAS